MANFHPLVCLLLLVLSPPFTRGIKIGISQGSGNVITTTPAPTTEAAYTTTNLELSSLNNNPAPLSTLATFPPKKPQPSAPSSTAASEASADNSTSATAAAPIGQFLDYYCSCDLLPQTCDVNCCCDRDCQPEVLKVFNCLNTRIHPQLQTRLEDFHYTHGLPACRINDGWLCVFRVNTKPDSLQTLSHIFDSIRYNKWPELLSSYELKSAYGQQAADFYKFGEPLQLWQPETKQLSLFELPSAFESAYCLLQQPVRHLMPLASSCLFYDTAQLQQNLWPLLNLTTSHRLLARPYSAQEHDDADINEAAELSVQICQQCAAPAAAIVCMDNATELQCDGGGYISHVELLLNHNYTHILSAQLLLKESSNDSEAPELWQHFKVHFNYSNGMQQSAATPIGKPTSGPLGYLQGEPILMAKLLPSNESDGSQQQLSYFHSNAVEQHWLQLFTSKSPGNLCQRSLDRDNAIEYGVNVVKQCELYRADLLQAHKNYTAYCEGLQQEIWRLLLPHNCSSPADVEQIFVSQLGKPQLHKWLPMRVSISGEELAPVRGEFSEEQQSFSCRNMLLSVRYDFHVTQLTLLDGQVPHQRVVKHAVLQLGAPHDLAFYMDEEVVQLPLVTAVMFYNSQSKRLNSSASNYGLMLWLLLWPVGLSLRWSLAGNAK